MPIDKSSQLFETIRGYRPIEWPNPSYDPVAPYGSGYQLGPLDLKDCSDRLIRFQPLIKKAFPETADDNGRIESPLRELLNLKEFILTDRKTTTGLAGRILLKCDNELPISGSVKARGGIYEVLCLAEKIALEQGILSCADDYSSLLGESAKSLFSRYAIAVGSTGNLGLSIGIMGAALGFRVQVHMSADAKEWKKAKLRSLGVNVVEYAGDYGKAVAAGRIQAQSDPYCHFIDDENSKTLFVGYSGAAQYLQSQLEQAEIPVDCEHPLIVYLPCGVGGGPGGITFGLREVFGQDVHCIFVEPTHSPAMLLGLASGLHDKISVSDIGLDNKTAADGLAVGRPSGFVGRFLASHIAGVFTVEDEELFRWLYRLYKTEGLFVEPSAAAGLACPLRLEAHAQKPAWLSKVKAENVTPENVTHLVWATGGSMVEEPERLACLERGRLLCSAP